MNERFLSVPAHDAGPPSDPDFTPNDCPGVNRYVTQDWQLDGLTHVGGTPGNFACGCECMQAP